MEHRVTEYANQTGNRGPYQSLAKATGVSLRRVVELAEQNRLTELFGADGRLRGTPPRISGVEARRALHAKRYPTP